MNASNLSNKSSNVCQCQTIDKLTEQLRHILIKQNDRMAYLNKINKHTMEKLLRHSDRRTKMSVEQYQRLLNMLDLKLVVLPR
jgi:hypothetical protein